MRRQCQIGPRVKARRSRQAAGLISSLTLAAATTPTPRRSPCRFFPTLLDDYDEDWHHMRIGDEHFAALMVRTKEKNGPSLPVDTVSPSNLCSDQWSQDMAVYAKAHGRSQPSYEQKPRPLRIKGAGNGHKEATYDVIHDIGLVPLREQPGCSALQGHPRMSYPMVNLSNPRWASTLCDCALCR